MTKRYPTDWSFFLGGHDLEMAEIARLLESRAGVELYDKGLRWGARASAYADEIASAVKRGRRAVLVELEDDLPASFSREGLEWVDHHGARAGDLPTSLEQVFKLLDLPAEEWTTDRALVAANDRGHVEAMARLGATAEQMRAIRERDRKAQGISAEEEEEGARAARRAEPVLGGLLTVVRLPHDRSATVTDALDARLGGPGFENLLVLGATQTHFFGAGKVIAALGRWFPGGWQGGELPARGFWGFPGTLSADDLIRPIGDALHG